MGSNCSTYKFTASLGKCSRHSERKAVFKGLVVVVMGTKGALEAGSSTICTVLTLRSGPQLRGRSQISYDLGSIGRKSCGIAL